MKKTYRAERSSSLVLREAIANGAKTVGELWDRVHSLDPDFEFAAFRDELNQLVSQGVVDTGEPMLSSFRCYLRTWRFGFRFWLTVGGILVALIVVSLPESDPSQLPIRWVAGTLLVLFAPGYALTRALFPSERDLSSLNRLAITIAMSLFLVPTVALLLNYTPLGIRAEPMSRTLAGLSLALLLFGAHREFLLVRKRQDDGATTLP